MPPVSAPAAPVATAPARTSSTSAAVVPEPPQQHVGRSFDIVSSQSAPSEDAARGSFLAQARALLDVNRWASPGLLTKTGFALHDAVGRPVERPASVGDFVRIDLPGPVGHDWVRVEAAGVDDARAAVTLRPSHDPRRAATPAAPDHFYRASSTNTLAVELDQAHVVASATGRNIEANGPRAGAGLVNGVRNVLIAKGGMATQNLVWSRFLRNLQASGR